MTPEREPASCEPAGASARDQAIFSSGGAVYAPLTRGQSPCGPKWLGALVAAAAAATAPGRATAARAPTTASPAGRFAQVDHCCSTRKIVEQRTTRGPVRTAPVGIHGVAKRRTDPPRASLQLIAGQAFRTGRLAQRVDTLVPRSAESGSLADELGPLVVEPAGFPFWALPGLELAGLVGARARGPGRWLILRATRSRSERGYHQRHQDQKSACLHPPVFSSRSWQQRLEQVIRQMGRHIV